MRYVGGKGKTGRAIVNEMLKRFPAIKYYIEPFVGACNTLIHVPGPRLAIDSNPYLIHMWQAVQQGWLPPDKVSESLYQRVKNSPDDDPPLTAFIGFACSFGAKWFGGYARGDSRNYAAEGLRGILKKAPHLEDVIFHCGDYREAEIPPGGLVYCDPPYGGTTGYDAVKSFDTPTFWAWAKTLEVPTFVSEYAAPDPWEVVWSKTRAASLDLNTGGKQAIERLFMLPRKGLQCRAT